MEIGRFIVRCDLRFEFDEMHVRLLITVHHQCCVIFDFVLSFVLLFLHVMLFQYVIFINISVLIWC